MDLRPTREESGKGVPRDEAIEEKCFEMAMRLLDDAAATKAPQSDSSKASQRGMKGKKGKKGKEGETSNDVSSENDPFKIEHVFVVQYGALQALGLLLRSDIGLRRSPFLCCWTPSCNQETFSNEGEWAMGDWDCDWNGTAKWWPRLSPTFVEVLSNNRYAAMVKASVMMTFGKLSFYMKESDPHLETITVCFSSPPLLFFLFFSFHKIGVLKLIHIR